MEGSKEKPRILVSKCIGFEACRYNGSMVKDNFVDKLSRFVEFVQVCPEKEIGMETPRDPIRLVKDGEYIRLVQPKTNNDYTKSMVEFSDEFLNNVSNLDGCILKSRSPSCGIKDVKIYSSIQKGAASSKGRGIFGKQVIEKFPMIAIEDDGRLNDFNIREHFLTKVFVLNKFRQIKQQKNLNKLIDFHKNNKLLFMMYNKSKEKILENKILTLNTESIDEIFQQYENELKFIFARNARYTSKVNVLEDCFKSFSDRVSKKEEQFVMETIEKYRQGKVAYCAPLYLIKSYALRFNDLGIINQSLFNPYPGELVEMRDSGKSIT